MPEHECTCTNCGGREHCKIKFEPFRKCCCFWKPEFKPIWIPCSERLPEQEVRILLFAAGEVYVGELTDIKDVFDTDIGFMTIGHVTHWMPLPEPPESEVQKHANQ